MKEHGIIPKGALCVKVLGGGIIDKPLKVKANKFSASAIKMVALTGGEAIKTKTARIKNP
jgi:ribosomal protein L15